MLSFFGLEDISIMIRLFVLHNFHRKVDVIIRQPDVVRHDLWAFEQASIIRYQSSVLRDSDYFQADMQNDNDTSLPISQKFSFGNADKLNHHLYHVLALNLACFDIAIVGRSRLPPFNCMCDINLLPLLSSDIPALSSFSDEVERLVH